MTDNRKQKLIELGVETLADALIELSGLSNTANDKIERMISTPADNVNRFKKKLTSLKRSKRFIGWRESHAFEQELELLLEDLKSGVTEPLLGLELVAKFYEADESIFERCDDSDGIIGDIFRITAKELFEEYATRCDDKEKVADIIIKLCSNDGYGVRDALLETTAKCLPKDTIRSMIAKFQKKAEEETQEYTKSHYLLLVKLLAKQIKDAGLFQKTYIESYGKLTPAGIIDIARIQLENGDIEKAHSLLKKITDTNSYFTDEKDELLKEIYRKNGDTAKLTELLFKKLREDHCRETLDEYLKVIGNDKREQVITDEVEVIMNDPTLNYADAEFLMETGKIDEAEGYILKRADQLNGKFYDALLSIVKLMESESRDLATSMIYRSLLTSILERAYNKAYTYGVRYLRKLDKLADNITDWKGFINQEEFKDQLMQTHGRKQSFWSKYSNQK
ncbi:MAG: hypothetical protein K9N06_11205 [Candidatus Cloacimonetes bacterium]|nr:hypothetical protein [Candidatus Cloacimonadota bacterium]